MKEHVVGVDEWAQYSCHSCADARTDSQTTGDVKSNPSGLRIFPIQERGQHNSNLLHNVLLSDAEACKHWDRQPAPEEKSERSREEERMSEVTNAESAKLLLMHTKKIAHSRPCWSGNETSNTHTQPPKQR